MFTYHRRYQFNEATEDIIIYINLEVMIKATKLIKVRPRFFDLNHKSIQA